MYIQVRKKIVSIKKAFHVQGPRLEFIQAHMLLLELLLLLPLFLPPLLRWLSVLVVKKG